MLTSATSVLTFRDSSIYGPRFLTGLGRDGDCRFDGFFSLGDSLSTSFFHTSVCEYCGVCGAVAATVFRESGIGVLPWLRQRRK